MYRKASPLLQEVALIGMLLLGDMTAIPIGAGAGAGRSPEAHLPSPEISVQKGFSAPAGGGAYWDAVVR